MLSGPSDVRLDRALLLLAECRPGGAPPALRGEAMLDALAERVAADDIDTLVTHLFADEGFRGDRVDYHDPRNSFLDHVLERRQGMPITLSVVLVEVGRRLGLALDGVGMPGHFLVRERDDPTGFIDPFHDGVRIDVAACAARFRAIHGDQTPFHLGYLDPVTPRSIVIRVLNNLTVTYRTRTPRDLDWLLDIRLRLPADPPDLRALSELCELRGRFADAADLLERIAASMGPDADPQRVLERAHRLRARLN